MNNPNPPRGQVLVIAAVAMLGMIAMVALIIDGGHAWTQQRDSQNGSDATSEAGALVLVASLSGATAPVDGDVLTQVTTTAAANGVQLEAAYYTDIAGTMLRPDGSSTADESQAARVGGGLVPPCSSCVANHAAGVRAVTSKSFSTFFAQIIGFPTMSTQTNATAVSGYVQKPCENVEGCPLVPVTVAVTVTVCDGQNKAEPSSTRYIKYVHYVIPLCHASPGNVGWIDWEPPAGGSSELAAEIANPKGRYVTIPEWYAVSETGNPNTPQIEDALRKYQGQVILIPMFDSTCNIDPPGPSVLACPPANVGGNGNDQWYHFPQVGAFRLDSPSDASFHLEGAYINGNNSAICDAAGGNGATSCLTGMFTDFTMEGEVGAAPPTGTNPSTYYGIQLIH
jgi:hypothetical protein